MIIGYFVISLIYPFSLLCASVIRSNVISYGYFLMFLLSIYSLPHRSLHFKNVVSSSIPIVNIVLPISSIIMQILINVAPHLFMGVEFFKIIGINRYSSFLDGIYQLLPDLVILVLSIISLILWINKKVFSMFLLKAKVKSPPLPALPIRQSNQDNNNNNQDNSSNIHSISAGFNLDMNINNTISIDKSMIHSPPSRTLTGFAFLMLSLSAVSFPSIINAIYFIFVIGFILSLSNNISIHKLMLKIYPIFIFISCLHLAFVYFYQIKYVFEEFEQVYDWYGIRNYKDWDKSVWPLVIGYVAIMLLYISTCLIKRKYDLYSLTKPRYRQKLIFDEANPNQDSHKFTRLAEIFSIHGWTICCSEIIVVCFFLNTSIFTAILLGLGLTCTLVPLKFFKRLIYMILMFFVVFIIAQYAINIPFAYDLPKDKETVQNLGLIKWTETKIWLNIGIQLIVVFTIALYCFYSDIQKLLILKKENLEKLKSKQVSNNHNMDSKLLDIEFPKEPKTVVNTTTTTTTTTTTSTTVHKRILPKKPLPPLPSKSKQTTSFNQITDVNESFSILLPSTVFLSDNLQRSWNTFKLKYSKSIKRTIEISKNIMEILLSAIISQSYRIALVGLFFCGLTSVNLLNAGYMTFFIAFVISETLADRLWTLLIIYAQMALMLLYIWQLSWTKPYENSLTQIIGLTHYSNPFLGLVWHLVIITFTLTQWHVNKIYKHSNIEVEEKKKTTIANNMPKIFLFIGSFLYNCIQKLTLPACYLVIVLVCLFSQISLISLISMATVFLCLLIHQISINSRNHIRRFWIIIILSQALILVARYAYQFEPVYQYILNNYPKNNYLTVNEIGLQVYDKSLFKELIGDVLILVILVFQLSIFFSQSFSESYSVQVHLNRYPVLSMILYGLNRFSFLHGPKVVLWTVFIVSLENINFFNLIYLVMVCVSMIFQRGTYRIGSFILFYSQLLVLTQMAALFPTAKILGNQFKIDWLGLGQNGQGIWNVIKYNLLIISIISIQQASYWWNKNRILQRKEKIEKISEKDSVSLLDNQVEEGVSIEIIDKDIENQREGIETPIPQTNEFKSLGDKTKWYISNFYKLYGIEILFIVTSISLCWRVNILGFIYLITIAFGLNISTPKKMNRLILFSSILVPIIIAQYILLLGLPLADKPFPWLPWSNNNSTSSSSSNDHELFKDELKNIFSNNNQEHKNSKVMLASLLLLTSPSPKILIVDFMVLFFSMLLLKQYNPYYLINTKENYNIPSKNFLKFSEEDYTKDPRPWFSSIRYTIVRFSSQIVLLVIFIAGTSTCDILSTPYVLFAVFVLFSGNAEHTRKWTNLWRAMAVYNWLVILSQIVFQFIYVFYIYSGKNPVSHIDSSAKILGFSVVYLDNISTAKNTISDVIILILLAYQKVIFQSRDFQLLEDYLKSKQDFAYENAREFYRERRNNRLELLNSIQSKIEQRRKRLVHLKKIRQKKKRSSIYINENYNLINSNNNNNNLNIDDNNNNDNENNNNNNNIKQVKFGGAETINDIDDKENVNQPSSSSNNNEPEPIKKSKIIDLWERFLDWIDPLPMEIKKLKNDQTPKDNNNNNSNPNNNLDDDDDLQVEFKVHNSSDYRNSVFIDSEQMRIALLQMEQQHQQQQQDSTKEKLDYYNNIYLMEKNDITKRLARGFTRLARDESKWLAFVLCICNGIFYSSIISLIYVFSVFLYGRLFESPRPSKAFWRFLIGYSSAIVCIKYIFQIGIFCICSEATGVYYASFGQCQSCPNLPNATLLLSLPYTIGLYTIDGYFLKGAFWDLAILLGCLWHRHVYRSKGLWNFDENDFYLDQDNQPIKQLLNQLIEDQQTIIKDLDGSSSSSNNSPILDPITTSNQEVQPQHEEVEVIEENDLNIEQQSELDPNQPSSSSSQSYDISISTISSNNNQKKLNTNLPIIDKLVSGIKWFIFSIIEYVWLVTRSDEKPGRDYYIPIFFTDFLCLLFLVIFPQNFTAIPSSDITQFLEQNVIPRQYIGILLLQFGVIILDRVIYLYKSLKAKFILQIILTILYHVFLYFYFPDLINLPFDLSTAWTLVIFYLLKAIYLYFSALQICYGYPIISQGRFLMDGHSDFHNIGFAIYRAIPFVYEMRTLLDWIVTDTTLLFYDWLKFEDLYAQVFSVKCRLEWIKRQGRKKGQKQPKFEKFVTGVTFFVGLVLILWFPLIILSSGLPGSNIEPVTNVQIQASIMGWNPFLSINQDLTVESANGTGGIQQTLLNSTEFEILRKSNSFITPDELPGTQNITISPFSEEYWNLSPPAKQQLIQYLNSSVQLSINADFTITRSGNINVAIPGSNSANLEPYQQAQLLSILMGTSTNNSFSVNNLFYQFIRLPGVSGNLLYPSNQGSSPQMINMTFTCIRNPANSQQYWKLTQTNGQPLQFFTISSKLPNGITSTLVSAGIIGLYVSVVLSVGRFLRLYVTGLSLRIEVENLDNCDEVLKMVDDVFIAREYGDLGLEEELYWELIQIFRQPNLLYQITKRQ